MSRRPIFILVMILWGLTSPIYGTASYYTLESCLSEGGTGITASGEVYNQYDLTCAMRTRDFNHLWRVCNRTTQKCVDVRNNDYGPNDQLYQQGRIIDLSQRAFKQIADLDTGIVAVSIQKIQ